MTSATSGWPARLGASLAVLALRQGAVARCESARPDDADEGDDRQQERGDDAAGTSPRRKERDRVALVRSRHESRRYRESRQRDRGHLPVPVDTRVDEVRRVCRERSRDERRAPCEHGGDERHAERQDEEQEPDRPQLGQGLEVEVVRVTNLVLDRPVLVPVLLVGARPGAEERIVLVVTPGDVPKLGSVAPGEREQPVLRLTGFSREVVVNES